MSVGLSTKVLVLVWVIAACGEQGGDFQVDATFTGDELPGQKTGLEELDKNSIQLSFDSDGDGVSDTDELRMGTDPNDSDTDDDGVMEDVDFFPVDPEETGDFDLDGIGDNSDPDDDNDGSLDVNEIARKTDPLNSDSDNDSVIDGDDAFPLDESRYRPEFNISSPSSLVTNSQKEVIFTLGFPGASDFDLKAEDVTLVTTGDVVCASGVKVNRANLPNPEVVISGCTGNGDAMIKIVEGQASYGKTLAFGGESNKFIVDNIAPTVTFGAPSQTVITKDDTVELLVNYEVQPMSLSTSVFSLDGATNGCDLTLLNSNTLTPKILITGCDSNGSLTVSVTPGTSVDFAGNFDVGGSSSASITVVNAEPSVLISAPNINVANNAAIIIYNISYVNDDGNYNLNPSDISLSTSGTVACATPVTVMGGSTATPQILINGCIGDGTVSAIVAADVVQNLNGDPNPVSQSDPVTIDNIAPSVSIGAPSVATINSAGSTTFTLTYEVAPTALVAGDITVNGDNAGCAVAIADAATTTPDVTVSGCSGNGSFTISVAAGESADVAGNVDIGAGPSASVTVANSLPTVNISAPSATQIRSADTLTYNLSYTNATTLNGVLPADITLAYTGGVTCTVPVTVNNGATATPSIEITGCSGDGTVTMSVAAGVVENAASVANVLTIAAPVTVDNTAPTVTIGAPSASAINSAGSTTFTLTYEVAPTALVAGDITVNGDNAGCAVAIADAATTTPDVTVSSCSGNGSFTISVAAGESADAVGNLDAGAGPSAAVTVDNSAPTVTIGAPSASAINSAGSTTFTLTYEVAPTALVAGDITVNGDNAGCAVAIADAATTTPDVSVSGCSGNGSITISVAAGESADAVGNLDAGAGPSASVVVDNTAPTVSISPPSNFSMNSSGSTTYTLTYEIAPTALVAADVTINGASAGCTVGITDAATTTPDITISNCSGNGNMNITVAAGESVGAAGNVDIGHGVVSTVTIDNTPPTVSIGAPSVAAINASGSTTFTLAYEVAPTALVAGDITVNGDIAGCAVAIADATTTTPDVTVSSCSGNGGITVSLAAGESADTAGNTDVGAGPSAAVTVDNTAPTVTIGSPSVAAINSSGSTTFTLTYEVAPTALVAGDITVNGDNAGCTVGIADAATTTPDVTISNCSGDGSITISVAAGESADTVGNTDVGAGPSSAVTVDNTPPAVVFGTSSLSLINSSNIVVFPMTYEVAPVGLVLSDFTISGDSADCVMLLSGSASTNPSVQISGCSSVNGSITLSVAGGRSTDAAGNVDIGAGPSVSVTVVNDPNDTDGDGLDNDYETLIGTNPNSYDDKYWGETILLAHFEDPTDSSLYGHTLSTTGTTAISGAESRFGQNSALLTNGCYSFTPSMNVDLADVNITLEGFFNVSNTSAELPLIEMDNGVVNLFLMKQNSSEEWILRREGVGGDRTFGNFTYSPPTSTWVHWAVVYNDEIVRVFMDGSYVGGGYLSANGFVPQTYRIGCANGFNYSGYLDEIRVTLNARYGHQGFIPPTAAFAETGSPKAYNRHYRITGSVTGAFFEIEEIDFWNLNGKVDETGATYSTDIGSWTVNPFSVLHDDLTGSRTYVTAAVANASLNIMSIDFGAGNLQQVNAIVQHTHSNSDRYLDQIQLYASDDGTNWNIVGDVSGIVWPGASTDTLPAYVKDKNLLSRTEGHLHWRLTGLQVTDSGYIEMSELAIVSEDSKQNYINNSDSQFVENFSPNWSNPANLYDGSASNRGFLAKSALDAEERVYTWELREKAEASALRFGGWDNSARFSPRATVEYSDDGSSWNVLGAVAGVPYPGNSTLSPVMYLSEGQGARFEEDIANIEYNRGFRRLKKLNSDSENVVETTVGYSSGKRLIEFVVDTAPSQLADEPITFGPSGSASASQGIFPIADGRSFMIWNQTDGTAANVAPTISRHDRVTVWIDFDAKKLWVAVNDLMVEPGGDPIAGTNPVLTGWSGTPTWHLIARMYYADTEVQLLKEPLTTLTTGYSYWEEAGRSQYFDSDADGVNDVDEGVNGTNPNLADTDSDGVDDYVESVDGTNPLIADTDGDGYDDGVEKTNGTNPLVDEPPTVEIAAPSSILIRSVDTVTFTLTYEVAPVGLVAGDITLNGTTAGCGVAIVDAATTTPDVQVSGCTGNGSFSITVAAGRSQDAGSNFDIGAGPSSFVTVDNTAPTVSIGAPSLTTISSSDTTSFTLTYEIAPGDLVPADITLSGATTGCSVTIVDAATTTPYVEVGGCSGNGFLTISVAAGESVDPAGNTDAGAGPSAQVTVDNSSGGPPTALFFTGPPELGESVCGLLTLKLVDASSEFVAAASNVNVNLTPGTSGTFYSDSVCTSAVTATTIASGQFSKAIYYSSTVAGAENLQAADAAATLTSDNHAVTIVTVGTTASFDSGFGTNGVLNETLAGSTSSWVSHLLVQDDGKIISLGNMTTAVGLADSFVKRYNADSTADTSFATNGLYHNDFGGTADDKFRRGELQPDGKILLTGFVTNTDQDVLVVRLNADGSLDSTFGTGGILEIDVGTTDLGADIKVLADGKIVIGGHTNDGIQDDFLLIKLNSNGSFDNTFGTNGILVFDATFASAGDKIFGIEITNGGDIIAGGMVASKAGVARFSAIGVLDTSYAGDGVVNYNNPLECWDIAIQPDDKVLCTGWRDGTVLSRINTDGTIDFENLNQIIGEEYPRGIALQPDGKIVVVGGAETTDWTAYMHRYNSDGTIDTSFSGDGAYEFVPSDLFWSDWAVAIQPDGKILVGGHADNGHMSIIRMWP